MENKFNIGFAGMSDTVSDYRSAVDKFKELSFAGFFNFPNEKPMEDCKDKCFDNYKDFLDSVDIICFFGEKIQRKYIADAIRAMKHVFVDDYESILNTNLQSLCDLADEAGIVTQVSVPKMYYWGIHEITESYKNISYISFEKASDYSHYKTIMDVYPEIIAISKLAGSEVVAAQCRKFPLVMRKSEIYQIDLDFLNGVNAVIDANPCALYDREELNIVAEKNMAFIDLRKREWHNLVYKTSTSEPMKETFSLDEIPFVERNEMKNMIDSITKKSESFVSFKLIRSLKNCIDMM